MIALFLGNLNYSSWSIRGALVARMSGLPVQETILPLGNVSTRETLMEKTGYRQVPALVDGSLIIRDSLAITEYLAEKVPAGTIWPEDPVLRTKARVSVAEMHSSFSALRQQCYVDIRSRRPEAVLSDATKADIARVLTIWAECRAASAGAGPYLFGNWSAADAFYAPVVTRFRTYGVALEGEDAAYAEAVLGHPDMQAIERAAAKEAWVMAPGPSGMIQISPDLT